MNALLAALLLALLAPGAAADVYKWQDEKGLWHFSDRPPEDGSVFEEIHTPADPRARVSTRRTGPRENPEHWFFNRYHGPAEIELSVQDASNVRSDPPLPARFVLPPNAEKALVRFSPARPGAGFRYRLAYRVVPGRPMDTLPDDLDFHPPIGMGETFPISQGLDDSTTHSDSANRYAVDIAMPIGTPVLAARGGVVMDTEDDFRGGGKHDERYLPRANTVRILHDDGSMALYAHLQEDSIRVRPGLRVAAGHWIANSGNTGYSSGPHLHFVVQINTGMALESLPFRFRRPGGGVMDPDRPQLLRGVLPVGRN
ncbi:MAG: M23 family metallopeptidase [Gammaproteobacteria bacterium]